MPHLHASTVEVSPGAQVQLSCDPGFYLVGEPLLQCQNKGEWSHPLPSCERMAQTFALYIMNNLIFYCLFKADLKLCHMDIWKGML